MRPQPADPGFGSEYRGIRNIAAETLLSMIGLPTGIEGAEALGILQRQSRQKP